MFGESPNIARVVVDGTEVDQDFDLDAASTFTVQTDAGNDYEVKKRTDTGRWTRSWDVFERLAGGEAVRVGEVLRAFLAQSYQFTPEGAFLPGGTQGNLWNAVQSLTK
jgi:hypothetical protein